MEKDLNVLLIRGISKLCQEAEDFLKENKIQYDLLYADKNDVDNLPVIFSPNSCIPYEGQAGFNLFKYPYLKKEFVYD